MGLLWFYWIYIFIQNSERFEPESRFVSKWNMIVWVANTHLTLSQTFQQPVRYSTSVCHVVVNCGT